MLTLILTPVKTQNPGRVLLFAAHPFLLIVSPWTGPVGAGGCPHYPRWLETSSRCHQDEMQRDKHKRFYFHP